MDLLCQLIPFSVRLFLLLGSCSTFLGGEGNLEAMIFGDLTKSIVGHD